MKVRERRGEWGKGEWLSIKGLEGRLSIISCNGKGHERRDMLIINCLEGRKKGKKVVD